MEEYEEYFLQPFILYVNSRFENKVTFCLLNVAEKQVWYFAVKSSEAKVPNSNNTTTANIEQISHCSEQSAVLDYVTSMLLSTTLFRDPHLVSC